MSDFMENPAWADGPFLHVAVAGTRPMQPAFQPRENTTDLLLDMGPRHHRGFWAVQLDDAAKRAREPLVIVAHGIACLAVVRWAQLSPRSYFANIAGACLVSPLSFAPAQAALAQALLPSPSVSLPFPSIVVEHRADPMIAYVFEMADIWKSRFVEAERFPGWSPPVMPLPVRGADPAAPLASL